MGRRSRNISGSGRATVAISKGRRRVLFHREDLSAEARASRREAAESRRPVAVHRRFMGTISITTEDPNG